MHMRMCAPFFINKSDGWPICAEGQDGEELMRSGVDLSPVYNPAFLFVADRCGIPYLIVCNDKKTV